ncbi:C4-dicarboxylate ABC transporter permease [Fusobacterium ulcerans]|uniref:Neu5Ac permease n=2 Tax=Fusobacterium ulcerans TaxID=861 RepID=A0AAX2J803_9FUSO|nr:MULTISPECIES: TRAP transporter fused permease subunit [Fusobacterium]AVQ28235.1 C4-dicarboxylate ABC transporter permease [Fusobacterium ulcerans]EFS25700.1 TRAP transporter, 4TM/12TM fusion protein [Fusobacterium ulcerans ATCC 49185]EHO80086.1 TRAP transporter, 4TM/12TM fusion protein [Fusobacterium ulcerans 12-1B]MCB8566652.1 TRAP transporter fused permease subunit [Fusobacterium ulcerans]MCB8650817.1 TRAP transporter fused permease subunit [Fusobacterium ulcerans]
MEKSSNSIRNYILNTIVVIFIGFQLYLALIKPLDPMLQNPMHLILALLVIFIVNPADKNSGKKWMKLLDIPFFAGIIFLLYYTIVEFPRLSIRVQYVDIVTALDKAATVICIIILLEAVRRTLGKILFIFILLFIIYDWLGMYCPGILYFKGTNMRSFTETMMLGSGGIFGTPLYTSATSLFYFILFGAFFSQCGGGQLLIDFGMKFSNKSAGGPAKAAIISSGLMGMISGSAVANVSTTGVMTIPMMKKVGYEPHQAGAIEAVASTGGQIMPPIMGVGAFIMAEMLGVPYKTVAFAAIIPALAYYGSVFFLVTFMAKKEAIDSDKEAVTIEIKDPLLERVYMIIPAIVLVIYIISGKSLMRSGMVGIFAVLLCNLFSKFYKGGKYYQALATTANTAVDGVKQASNIAIPTAACGIIIGVVIQSGLATRFSNIIAKIGTSHLSIALIIAMFGCMLLGMALPTVAAYLVSNILFVPVLIKLNVNPLSANMFVFYFGIMAQITPPVCLASYTAAGIAGADSLKTGFTGFMYALVAFLVPFVFVYNPELLLMGTPAEIAKATAILFFGTYLLAGAISGYMVAPLNKFNRGILFIGALCMIAPETITDIIGLVIGVYIITTGLLKKKKVPVEA